MGLQKLPVPWLFPPRSPSLSPPRKSLIYRKRQLKPTSPTTRPGDGRALPAKQNPRLHTVTGQGSAPFSAPGACRARPRPVQGQELGPRAAAGGWVSPTPSAASRRPPHLQSSVAPTAHPPRPRPQEQRALIPAAASRPRLRESDAGPRSGEMRAGCPRLPPTGPRAVPSSLRLGPRRALCSPGSSGRGQSQAEPGVSTGNGRCPRCSRAGPAAPDLESKESGAESTDPGRGARAEGTGEPTPVPSSSSPPWGALPR